ncbi:hypothetical protein OIE71_03970 [Streptomyces sp. NBC_01725]|uniref:hypothetical protein n=1 Tax=Streptomyces sp. NBC_01725 TaxID=2975923 RepID=UPI002E28B087|nr:hypothetical protein [Streptomyces sp. NBC_01725]
MLKIGDITYDHRSPGDAKSAVYKAMGAAAPKDNTPQRSVLGATVAVAAGGAALFELPDVQQVYNDYLAQAALFATTTAADRAWCLQNRGAGTADQLAAAQRRQADTLAGLLAQGSVVITRGTNPVQARQILTHRTFGGLPPNANLTTPPTAEDADAQTGLGIKDTVAGRIEEWSLGQQTGFSLDGFMVIAEADVSLVTLPRSDGATRGGEAGVCGYAAAGLIRVAILSEGRPSGEPPEKRELERICVAIGRDHPGVVTLLKAAALLKRGVVL